MTTVVALSPRQWETLGHLAEGYRDGDIAVKMRIKPHTVQNYLHTIYDVLDIDPSKMNARVSAAKWYWTRKMQQRHFIIEAAELPVIIEVRKEPAGHHFREDLE